MKSSESPVEITDKNIKVLVVPVFEDKLMNDEILVEFDKKLNGLISEVIENGEINGKEDENLYIRLADETSDSPRRLLFIGAGKREDYTPTEVAHVAGRAARLRRKRNAGRVAMLTRIEEEQAAEAVTAAIEGALAGEFDTGTYQTKEKKNSRLESFDVISPEIPKKEYKEAVRRGRIVGESVQFARHLANEPPNVMTPSRLAEEAEKMAKEVGLEIEVFDEAKMQKMGMSLLLSVGNGSDQPSKMIVLKYNPKKQSRSKNELLALVGKAITFDTGGISIKAGENMDLMKYDMAGGAAVLGAMRAIAELKPAHPVLGVVAAAENMPSGKATRPSDVVASMSGKTVEILNTDAEGRLVLADAITYAKKQGAKRIVDVATLTGAIIIALGEHNAGIMGNDQKLVDQIIEAGKAVGENFWQMPLGKEYSKQIKSDIADIKNIGGRKAGSVTAAAFLQEFADDAAWAHLDIAGTAWLDDELPHIVKGPTGFGVRTLVKLTEDGTP